MKKILKGYLLGFLSAAVLVSGVAYAANTTTFYDVIANGIKIVIDGQKINPTDANGNKVEPIIYNGTTYLPVRAVANAFGKAVYWDGSNYTVYLGDMDGKLEYPTVYLEDVDNIGDSYYNVNSDELVDNYGNSYSSAIHIGGQGERVFQTLLNCKYSRFKCTLYVPQGHSSDKTEKIVIKADGKIIYYSPEITKTTEPINIDIDISGCNNFEIRYADNDTVAGHTKGYIGNGGFYQ